MWSTLRQAEKYRIATLAACALYVVFGSLWIDLQGLQADEVLFGHGIYRPGEVLLATRVFGFPVPPMLMPYLGALKSWLYMPIYGLFGVSAASTRIPMLLAGAATLWFVFALLRRVHSERAGFLAALLLATDPIYLWTARCDWGPVALQHLLTAAAVTATVRFYDRGRHRWLFLAGLCAGLALWNKGTMIWALAGFLVPALMVPALPRRLASRRAAGILLAALALGAYPVLRYNLKSGGGTARATAHFSLDRTPQKARNVLRNLDGIGLLGYVVRQAPAGEPRTPQGFQKAVVAVSELAGEPVRFGKSWLFLAALAAAPFLGMAGRTTVAYILGFWGIMAVTTDAGEPAHHVVLLFPAAHLLMGIALARLRPALSVLAATFFAVGGLAVSATHYSFLVRYGSDPPWSDAILPLAASLEKENAVRVGDWGIYEPLVTLSQGRLPVSRGGPEVPLTRGQTLVLHQDRFQAFQGVNQRFGAICRAPSARPVRDSAGVSVFQVVKCEN